MKEITGRFPVFAFLRDMPIVRPEDKFVVIEVIDQPHGEIRQSLFPVGVFSATLHQGEEDGFQQVFLDQRVPEITATGRVFPLLRKKMDFLPFR